MEQNARPEIVLWYQQHQGDQLVNRVRALRLLRQIRDAQLIATHPFLDHLGADIDKVLAEDDRLTAELLDVTKRVIRVPMHAPDREAA